MYLSKYELIPLNGRKSFYGKAIVYMDENGNEILYSYGTKILARNQRTGELTRFWDDWSFTTGTHIKSFYGLDKKGFLDLPLVRE